MAAIGEVASPSNSLAVTRFFVHCDQRSISAACALLSKFFRGDSVPPFERAVKWRRFRIAHQVRDLADRQRGLVQVIENGITLVRPAAEGISSAFDPWGRVLGMADFFARGDQTVTVQVPIGSIPTAYARIGDLFAWLCVAGLVAAVAIAVISPNHCLF